MITLPFYALTSGIYGVSLVLTLLNKQRMNREKEVKNNEEINKLREARINLFRRKNGIDPDANALQNIEDELARISQGLRKENYFSVIGNFLSNSLFVTMCIFTASPIGGIAYSLLNPGYGTIIPIAGLWAVGFGYAFKYYNELTKAKDKDGKETQPSKLSEIYTDIKSFSFKGIGSTLKRSISSWTQTLETLTLVSGFVGAIILPRFRPLTSTMLAVLGMVASLLLDNEKKAETVNKTVNNIASNTYYTARDLPDNTKRFVKAIPRKTKDAIGWPLGKLSDIFFNYGNTVRNDTFRGL
ncbi:MAG: hypothetical protein J0H68_02350 [Sphingobacteriia bacterium]|nr:hypothetical protein [Sphingobacteriia bacterium]